MFRSFTTSFVVLMSSLAIVGCGGSSPSTPSTPPSSIASQSDIAISATNPGVTPFISSVVFTGNSLAHLTSAQVSLSPMPNTVSKPVNITWSSTALTNRGYLNGKLSLPVIGLYAAFQNQVHVAFTFDDGSSQSFSPVISTSAYADPTGIYTNPTINKARSSGDGLNFNYMILKSTIGSPVILDTDGQVRWVVPSISNATSSIFTNSEFVIGASDSISTNVLNFDGSTKSLPLQLSAPSVSSYTHNIDPSPNGLLMEFNGTDDLGDSMGDIVEDVSPATGLPLQTFDMADILSSFMQANGDDPSQFVRPGADWFHVNASTYDPSDQSVIVSSREDFLIKINYATKNIVWILGDPTKYWYSFPSLRSKALLLTSGDYPIGQHAVSITSDGYVMVMNDGFNSTNQPAGAPQGITRSYSKVSAYAVNASAGTASEIWSFDYGQQIFSPICGSAYQASGGGYLVDFATAANETQARLIGLDAAKNVAFDFQYPTTVCNTAWNAIPINLEGLVISK